MTSENYARDFEEGVEIFLKCPFQDCYTTVMPLTAELAGTKLEINDSPQMVSLPQGLEENTNHFFYRVRDVWDFDNIGVSRPTGGPTKIIVEDKTILVDRLLVCSECDRGPLGFAGVEEPMHNTHENLKYFISCSSLLHKDK